MRNKTGLQFKLLAPESFEESLMRQFIDPNETDRVKRLPRHCRGRQKWCNGGGPSASPAERHTPLPPSFPTASVNNDNSSPQPPPRLSRHEGATVGEHRPNARVTRRMLHRHRWGDNMATVTRQKHGGGRRCAATREQPRRHLRWSGVGWLVPTLAGHRGRVSERARHRCYKASRTTSRHDHKPMHVGPARPHGGAPAAPWAASGPAADAAVPRAGFSRVPWTTTGCPGGPAAETQRTLSQGVRRIARGEDASTARGAGDVQATMRHRLMTVPKACFT